MSECANVCSKCEFSVKTQPDQCSRTVWKLTKVCDMDDFFFTTLPLVFSLYNSCTLEDKDLNLEEIMIRN